MKTKLSHTRKLSLSTAADTTEAGVLLISAYTGASLALSLRKLRDSYSGACVRVRRDSDNAEADIFFDGSNVIDGAAATAFAAGANLYVVKWYDQTKGSRHFSQPNASMQPRLHFFAKPVLQFDGVNDRLENTVNGAWGQHFYMYWFGYYDSTASNRNMYDALGTAWVTFYHVAGGMGGFRIAANTFPSTGELTGVVDQFLLITAKFNGASSTLRKDNNAAQSIPNIGTGGCAPLHRIGGAGGNAFKGYITELVFYPGITQTKADNVRANIMTHYAAY